MWISLFWKLNQLLMNATNSCHIGRPFLAYVNALINCMSKVMNLSFGNIRLELNVFNMCKQPCDKEDKDIENEDIKLIEPIIEEHIQDENVTYSMEIYFASSFESSKEYEYNIALYTIYCEVCW